MLEAKTAVARNSSARGGLVHESAFHFILEIVMQTLSYTVAAALAAFAATSTGAAQPARDSSASAAAVAAEPIYSEPMRQLQAAAQRLRESIQKLSQHAPGPERDGALRLARKALWDAQDAMIQLPPELRQAASASRVGVSPDYAVSMQKLQRASDRLYDAIHAMAAQPAGDRRNAAVRQATEALNEAEHAMIALPNVGATGGSGSGAVGGEGATSADAQKGKGGNNAGSASVSAPAIVLFSPLLVVDDKFSGGCWARFFGDQNFRGDTLTLSGPGDFAYLKTSYANLLRKWDSVALGPKTTLTAYDNDNFTQPVATFKPAQRIADLDDKLGFLENVRSVRMACSK